MKLINRLFFFLTLLAFTIRGMEREYEFEQPAKKIKTSKEEEIKESNFKPIFLPTALRPTIASIEIANLSMNKEKSLQEVKLSQNIAINKQANHFSIDIENPLIKTLLKNAKERNLPEIFAITLSEDENRRFYFIYTAFLLNKKLYGYEWDDEELDFLPLAEETEFKDPVYNTDLIAPTCYFLVDQENNFVYLGNYKNLATESTQFLGSFLSDILSFDLAARNRLFKKVDEAIYEQFITKANTIGNVFYTGLFNIEKNLHIAKQYFLYAHSLAKKIQGIDQLQIAKKLAYLTHMLREFKDATFYFSTYFDLILQEKNWGKFESKMSKDVRNLFKDYQQMKVIAQQDKETIIKTLQETLEKINPESVQIEEELSKEEKEE